MGSLCLREGGTHIGNKAHAKMECIREMYLNGALIFCKENYFICAYFQFRSIYIDLLVIY